MALKSLKEKFSKSYIKIESRKKPGRWHNGSMFVFCLCDCTFKTEPSPTSAHACGEVTDYAAATKRLASVAPEVNLEECTLHLPLQK